MKTVCKLSVLLLICLWFAPVRAQAPEPIRDAVAQARSAGIAEGLLDRMLAAGFTYQVDAREMVRWIGVIANAAQADLPVEPMIDKMEEGLAKKIAADNIHAAIQATAERLRLARLWVDRYLRSSSADRPSISMDPEEATIRVSQLFAAGLTPRDVERGSSPHEGSSLAQMVEALTFKVVLDQAGFDTDLSEQIVRDGLRSGFFKEFPLALAYTIKAAADGPFSKEAIARAAGLVVRGEQTVKDMQTSLGVVSGRGIAPARSGFHGSPDSSKGHSSPAHGGQGGGPGNGAGGGSGGGGSGGGGSGGGGGPGGGSGGGGR